MTVTLSQLYILKDSCKNGAVLAERHVTHFADKKDESENDKATGNLCYFCNHAEPLFIHALSMLDPCFIRALSMFIHALSMPYHALSMLYPCFLHALSMLYSCFIHALSTIYPCFVHALSMLYSCFIHALSMLYPCFIHASLMLYPCLLHTLSYNLRGRGEEKRNFFYKKQNDPFSKGCFMLTTADNEISISFY